MLRPFLERFVLNPNNSTASCGSCRHRGVLHCQGSRSSAPLSSRRRGRAMFGRYHITTSIVLAVFSVPCAAQVSAPHHLSVPPESVKTASPQCSAGVVYDDGIFADFYSIGNGDPDDATLVMKFDLPAGTTALDQVCACFARLNASSPSSMSFEVVAYDDNGAGGQPGTFLGSVNATGSSIPIAGSSQFYSVNLSGSGITLPDTSVYVGVRWPGGDILLCGDRSATTTQRTS